MTNEEKSREIANNTIICDGSWECFKDVIKFLKKNNENLIKTKTMLYL